MIVDSEAREELFAAAFRYDEQVVFVEHADDVRIVALPAATFDVTAAMPHCDRNGQRRMEGPPTLLDSSDP
jgi:hypothetical protein